MEPTGVCSKKYLSCSHCNPTLQCNSITELKVHWKNVHGDLVLFNCGQCDKLFRHKTSLLRHIKDHELNFDFLDSDDEENEDHADAGENYGGMEVHDMASDHDHDTEETRTASESEDVEEEINVQAEAAKFLLKLRSSGNLTNASVGLIQNFTSDLISIIVSHLKKKTVKFLNEANVDKNVSDNFISETFDLSNPFHGLETTDKQLDFFSQKYGLVKPIDMYLSSRIEHRLDRKTHMFLPTQVPETFQSVSLIGTLSLIAKNKYLRNLILSEKESTDGIYRGYKDGSDFKNNDFLQKYPDAFRIELNYDDLEMANGLGSKDVIHKIGPFYFRVQNLPPEENSELSSIFLLAMAFSEDLKKKGAFKKILTPFLEELKKLQTDEGIVIDLPEGGFFILRACLVCFCADSLAAHALLGFMSPSCLKFCRFCLLSKRELKESSNAIGELRTSITHKHHVEQVLADPTLKNSFGVVEESALAGVMKIPEDNVLDAFHDLVGVIQMVLKLVLYEFILVKKLFSVYYLNCNIVSFVYGSPEVKNKPSANLTEERLRSKGHTLKQSGSQTFCLLRIFPFIIKGVEEGDKFLELVFLLQDLVKIVFSFEVRPSDVDRLEVLITQHNSLFHELFVTQEVEPAGSAEEEADDPEGSDMDSDIDDPGETERAAPGAGRGNRTRVLKTKRLQKGINKLHHLCHYPKQFLEKGPMIRLWCARYEGRHRILRKHSSVQSNFKNIVKTMTRMFQLSTFDAIMKKKEPEIIISSTDSVQELVKNNMYQDILELEGLSPDDQVKIVKSVNVKGEDYTSGLFVVISSQEGSITFGLIVDIVVEVKDVSKIYLVVKECENQGLSGRYNSYKITNSFEAPPRLVRIESLIDYRPLPAWSPMESDGFLSLYLHPRNVFC